METISKSFNVFVDTALGDYLDGNGMNYMLNFNNLSIDVPDDAFFRLSLVDFCMLKSFTNVNTHNSKFILRLTNASAVSADFELSIPHKNYDTINSLAVAFYDVVATKIKDYINGIAGGSVDDYVISNLTPDNSVGITGTSDNVISATMTFRQGGTARNISTFLSAVRLQTYLESPMTGNAYSTAYQLLGSKVLKDNTDRNSSSMNVTTSFNTGVISISGFYPALRFNLPYLYLHCSLPSSNLATTSIDYYKRQQGEVSDLHHSNIIARFPIDSEIVTYNANNNLEFFIDVHQQHLTNIRFYLSMNNGEKIPEFATDQNILGNLSFSMTLRIDVIRKIETNKVNFGAIENKAPRQLSNVPTYTNSNRPIRKI